MATLHISPLDDASKKRLLRAVGDRGKASGIEAAAKIINFSNNSIEKKILDGCMVERPGWIRMSIHPTITNKEVLFVCESIKQVAENWKEWGKDYDYNTVKNEFIHKTVNSIEKSLVNKWFKQ